MVALCGPEDCRAETSATAERPASGLLRKRPVNGCYASTRLPSTHTMAPRYALGMARRALRSPFVATSVWVTGSALALAAATSVAGCSSDDGAGPTTCPAAAPSADAPCGKEGLNCSYGSCQSYSCVSGKFVFTGGGCNPPPVCPPAGTPLPAEGSDCTGYGGGLGSCSFPSSCGSMRFADCHGNTWSLAPDPCPDAGSDAAADAATTDASGDAASDSSPADAATD